MNRNGAGGKSGNRFVLGHLVDPGATRYDCDGERRARSLEKWYINI